jgi:thiosulfate/3-mercaptopyruvate sulfurtransferase
MVAVPSGISVSDRNVDVAWVASHRGDQGVRLVEVDVSRAAYDQGHIPGAALWNAYADLRDPAYQPIPRAAFAELIARSGITVATTVVVYGYGAALGFWLLTANGFPDVRILDGPRDAWVEAGYRWSTEVPRPSGVTPQELPDELGSVIATREAVSAAIADPSTILLDVRSDLEFVGERFWPSGATADAGRPGHIPGAISVPIDQLRADNGALREPDELRRVFEAAGVTRDRSIITYCTIGNRASHAWFALKHVLGYPTVAMYYGSWVDWGKRADTPVER